MTVAELIKALYEQDQDAEVLIPCPTGGEYIPYGVAADQDGYVKIS